MGGFGALVFADLVGADQVFAFDPQSTLHPPSVPFEDRFTVPSREIDFTGPYGSAVGKSTRAKTAFIFLDKHCAIDVAHAAALAGPNVRLVNVPFTGHGAAYAAQHGGGLRLIFEAVVSGDFDEGKFYAAMHLGRRKIARYWAGMSDLVKDRPLLRAIVDAARPASMAAP